MSRVRLRVRALPLVAALFMISGFALMIGALRITADQGRASRAESASVVLVPTVATAALASATPAASDPRATRLFARAERASRMLPYDGVTLVSRWSSTATSTTTSSVAVTVVHVPGRGTYVSSGDTDGTSPALASGQSYATDSGADDDAAMLAALVRNYRLDSAGSSSVAGRAADIVEADRADGSVAARFWIDEQTGLVLRRELLDTQGRTVEDSAFVRVAFTAPPTTTMPSPATKTWSSVSGEGVAALRATGWPVPATLTGGLDLYEVHEQPATDGTSSPVVQLSYTDGLVGVSVFEQRGVLDRTALTGYVSQTVDGGEVWVRSSSTPFVVWQTAAAPSSPTTAPSTSAVAPAAPVSPLSPVAPTTPGTAPTVGASIATPSGGDTGDIVVSATCDSSLDPLAPVLAAFPPRAAATDGVGDNVARGVQRVSRWFDPSQ